MNKTKRLAGFLVITLVFGCFNLAWAQEEPSECVVQGGLAFDNWTKTDAGGTGALPAGETNGDYVRCKACHGWDRRGTDGGYVRRSRKDSRPNAGAGDGDSTSRAIVTGGVTSDQIQHAGTGRSFADGTGSWVEKDAMHSAANTAAHSNGYTLGNQHPDFSGGDLTQAQVDCLVEFLNFADGDPGMYFADIDPSQNPVAYTIVDTADAAAGETLFNGVCSGCHTLQWATDYLNGDGKFSEMAHKVRWGVPNIVMTRSAMGNPTAQDVANLLAYLQGEGGTGFAINPGLTGTWWNADRAGEGFLLEVGRSNGEPTMFVSFYTYDNMGNQVWLFAQPSGPMAGDTVAVDVFRVTGPMWGMDFDPNDRDIMTWGSGEISFSGCGNGHVSLMPVQDAMGMGFTDLEYDLTRDLLLSDVPCPSPFGN